MARMNGADWQGEHGTSLMPARDILCVHTIVGNPPAHAAHFSTRADGWLYQSRDTRYRSAANLNGNYRVIAVENDDHGPEYGAWNVNDGHAVPGFTEAQKWTLVQLILWCHATHGIPIELVPDSKPGHRGIAYHRQGCDGNFGGYAYGGRVTGGELWSSSFGKVCPGDRRIAQLINEIIPRARQLAGLEEEDMPTAKEVADAVWSMQGYHPNVPEGVEMVKQVGWVNERANRIPGLEAKIAQLSAKVDALAVAGVDVAQLAALLAPALAAESDRRARDGNPATGPVT